MDDIDRMQAQIAALTMVLRVLFTAHPQMRQSVRQMLPDVRGALLPMRMQDDQMEEVERIVELALAPPPTST